VAVGAAVGAINVRNSSGSGDDALPIRREEGINHLVMMSRLLSHGLEQGGIHQQRILLLAVQERVKPRQVWIFRQTHQVQPTS
jgi:hypothetical protein